MCRLSFSFFVTAALFAVLVAPSSGKDYKVCGRPLFTPRSIRVSPDPPKVGGTMTITVKGRSRSAVERATFTYKLYYVLKTAVGSQEVLLLQESDDICKYTHCPIGRSMTFKYTVALPAILKEGLYKLEFEAKDNRGRSFICVAVHKRIVSSRLQT